MTEMEVKLAALLTLGLARQNPLAESAQEVYLEGLRDFPADVVRRACAELAKLAKPDYATPYPDLGTIREGCESISRADTYEAELKMLKPPPPVEREPTFHCLDCRDEPHNWRIFTCAGVGKYKKPSGGYVACDRTQDHGSHTFAVKCACAPYNPVSRAARERMQTYRAAPPAARRRTDARPRVPYTEE